MFFRPFWHPNSQAAIQDERLSQRLDAAEKKINDHAQLTSSLRAELKAYQNISCPTCQVNILATSEITATTTTVATANLGPTYSMSSVQRATFGPRDNHTDTSMDATSSSDNPQPGFHFPMTILPVSETTTGSDLDVEYNPNTNQEFSLYTANTFETCTEVCCTKFSGNGKYLAVGLRNGQTHIYDMTTGSKSVFVECFGVCYPLTTVVLSIWAVRFSPDNKYIATGGDQGQIKLWELGRRQVRANFKHGNIVRSIAFSPKGRFLASASDDKSACMWRIRDGSRRWIWHGTSSFMSVKWSPDGRYVAAGDHDGRLCLWDARTGKSVAKIRSSVDLRCLALTSDGKTLASGSGRLQCWAISSRPDKSGKKRKGDNKIQIDSFFESDKHKNTITAVCFSPDDRWLLSGSLDENLCIWDAQKDSWVCTVKPSIGAIWAADFSPDGNYIVCGGNEGQVRLYKIAS